MWRRCPAATSQGKGPSSPGWRCSQQVAGSRGRAVAGMQAQQPVRRGAGSAEAGGWRRRRRRGAPPRAAACMCWDANLDHCELLGAHGSGGASHRRRWWLGGGLGGWRAAHSLLELLQWPANGCAGCRGRKGAQPPHAAASSSRNFCGSPSGRGSEACYVIILSPSAVWQRRGRQPNTCQQTAAGQLRTRLTSCAPASPRTPAPPPPGRQPRRLSPQLAAASRRWPQATGVRPADARAMQRLRGLLGLGGGSTGGLDAVPHRKRSTDADEAVSELAALVPNGTVSSARVRTPRTGLGSRIGATTADAPAGGPVTLLTVSGAGPPPAAAAYRRLPRRQKAAEAGTHAGIARAVWAAGSLKQQPAISALLWGMWMKPLVNSCRMLPGRRLLPPFALL